MALFASGAVLGLLGALGATRLHQNLLFEVSASDPITYVGGRRSSRGLHARRQLFPGTARGPGGPVDGAATRLRLISVVSRARATLANPRAPQGRSVTNSDTPRA